MLSGLASSQDPESLILSQGLTILIPPTIFTPLLPKATLVSLFLTMKLMRSLLLLCQHSACSTRSVQGGYGTNNLQQSDTVTSSLPSDMVHQSLMISVYGEPPRQPSMHLTKIGCGCQGTMLLVMVALAMGTQAGRTFWVRVSMRPMLLRVSP
jgi:hypothetical protein